MTWNFCLKTHNFPANILIYDAIFLENVQDLRFQSKFRVIAKNIHISAQKYINSTIFLSLHDISLVQKKELIKWIKDIFKYLKISSNELKISLNIWRYL